MYIFLLCYSIYDGSLGLKESDAENVLRWISLIAMEDNIEHVSEQMLERLLQDHKVIIEMSLYSREKAFKMEQVDCNDDPVSSFYFRF